MNPVATAVISLSEGSEHDVVIYGLLSTGQTVRGLSWHLSHDGLVQVDTPIRKDGTTMSEAFCSFSPDALVGFAVPSVNLEPAPWEAS